MIGSKKYVGKHSPKRRGKRKKKRGRGSFSVIKKFIFILILFLVVPLLVYGSVDRFYLNYYNAATYISKVPKPKIKATGAVVYSEKDGRVLFGKNIDRKLDPLSTTKAMTVLLTMKKIEEGEISLETVFTTKKEDTKVIESKLSLKTGEKMTVKNLIHATLIMSANDAASVLGSNIAGSKAEFAKLMNQEAKAIGCTNTYFTNASGLIEKGNHSSARDIALIGKEAFKYPFVREVCQKKTFTLPPTNMYKKKEKIKSTNPFFHKYKKIKNPMKYYNIQAGKTGTWDAGNASLLEKSSYRGHNFITVVLGDYLEKRYPDTVNLMEYARKYFDEQKVINDKFGYKEGKRTPITPLQKLNDELGVGQAEITGAEYTEDGYIKLQWKDVKNAEVYKIYKRNDKGFKLVARVKRGSKLSFVDKKVRTDKIYTYYVRGGAPNFADSFLDLCRKIG